MRTLVIAALAAALGAALPGTASAQAPGQKIVVNAENGLAIEGYDPVSYFMAGPAKGSEAFTASYLGATYRFTSAEHRDLFAASPAKYAPQFGGYCGYGASRGYLASVDPEAYTTMNGRLILQNSKSVLKLWQSAEPDAPWLADANWPAIVEK
ncbi:MAG: YHS domain-containing (seleno)protein [Gemmatimonadales bacterium]